ncbi:WPP domain-associated protein [Olea europaea var. sylvestris]|uniref:WPP domain-associated protein n=1 Tax=Olea europaea var. sylvestris TaxID=158386 RepID=UPI000C1D5753|nr:WPP domain-associated protein [Olea europaea var. sylvestris]
MDNLFGEIDYRSNSDSIVMRLLRSAMDKAHEKVQSKDGPIEFLHERSKFYELAAILVEGGLNIVQEKADDVEDNRDKILSDLMEIRQWLQGRIKDMKHLIVKKDKELTEKLENELKLRHSLELKEREILCLHEKLEPGRMKTEGLQDSLISNEAIKDRAIEGDICELKNSLDQQVLNIKQKLEDEHNSLKVDSKKITSHVSSPDICSGFTDEEIHGNSGFKEKEFFWDDKFSRIPEPNTLIRWMSSDIDDLKQTLDLAFGRMQSTEVLPLEKQWRWTIEKDIESILVKGFTIDLQQSFEGEITKRICLLKDNLSEFIIEMRTICYELKSCYISNGVDDERQNKQSNSTPLHPIRRATSEPLLDYLEKWPEEHKKDDGSHRIRKPSKYDGYSNSLETRIEDAISRLDNLVKRKHNLGDKKGVSDRYGVQVRRLPMPDRKTETKKITSCESLKQEIRKLKTERNDLSMQILLMEDTNQVLFQGLVEDVNTKLCLYDTVRLIEDRRSLKEFTHYHQNASAQSNHDEADGEFYNSTSPRILRHYLESSVREDVYVVFIQKTVEEWKKTVERFTDESISQEETKENASDQAIKYTDSNAPQILNQIHTPEPITSPLNEMSESWQMERDAYSLENLIREDIYHFIIIEAVKDLHIPFKRSKSLLHPDFSEDTPRSRKTDGDERFIEKLDCLTKCLEVEEDLMLRASSEIKAHGAKNDLEVLDCEEADERNAIEWLLTDDERTFSSVGKKLEGALQQLQTSRELVVELEQSLEISDDMEENDHAVQLNNILKIKHEELQKGNNEFIEMIPSDNVLSIIIQLQQELQDFEITINKNLDMKCQRLEALTGQVDAVIKAVASIRKTKLLYEKAFISRCHNLKLAESEVDLLGDQVDTLLLLLEKIYIELNQNAIVLSRYFGVSNFSDLVWFNV